MTQFCGGTGPIKRNAIIRNVNKVNYCCRKSVAIVWKYLSSADCFSVALADPSNLFECIWKSALIDVVPIVQHTILYCKTLSIE